ncbi:RNA-binding (RRM/RBD/RNP motifs) family protein [Raphanus sativus]|uniref:Heterogeneous nuclear ribonucleoprotein 1 n=1 Tax=Raphanus sativus TaxID=3726 RepID=A0A6J0NN98_RAPSA|nr:heterogeneous nuclear ribonucleoprotein 1 [Raphanus sativus]KAJ4903504.1 RNA-binding (RRM/RBD/RNP motifs) family protein [Raphanus sativus]
MESDQGKLFIGGISWDTDENLLREYFTNYGEVSQVTVMREKATSRPRGFGFVSFSDPAVIDRVLQTKHHIDNRDVDVKRAMSREEQSPGSRGGSFSGASRSFDSGGANVRTKKIFVGGLPPALTSDEFRAYFESYGPVSDAVIMIDQTTQRPRGFGFVSFDSEDSVDLVLHKTFHDLNGKQVEVKRALPKDANPGVAGGGGGGRGGGGGFPGYGEGRVDSSRYMPPQNAGGSGYPPYGAGYGYGSNGVGYGGFGGYGNPSGAPYGNPGVTVPGAGFGSGPRSSWGGQAPSGYGNVGYGNAAAPAAPWGGSGPGSAVMGQGGASAGYGGQGYGYGGNDSSYGTPSGYGAVGGRPNSLGGGYADGLDGYGNHQGNGQAGYGGGYGSGNQALQQ